MEILSVPSFHCQHTYTDTHACTHTHKHAHTIVITHKHIHRSMNYVCICARDPLTKPFKESSRRSSEGARGRASVPAPRHAVSQRRRDAGLGAGSPCRGLAPGASMSVLYFRLLLKVARMMERGGRDRDAIDDASHRHSSPLRRCENGSRCLKHPVPRGTHARTHEHSLQQHKTGGSRSVASEPVSQSMNRGS